MVIYKFIDKNPYFFLYRAIPIKDSYRHQIAELEGKLLIRPKMDYTRGKLFSLTI